LGLRSFKTLPDGHGLIGEWKFNQISFRPDKHKAKSEVVILKVPALIDQRVFEQKQLGDMIEIGDRNREVPRN
jgi:hypothetical protein